MRKWEKELPDNIVQNALADVQLDLTPGQLRWVGTPPWVSLCACGAQRRRKEALFFPHCAASAHLCKGAGAQKVAQRVDAKPGGGGSRTSPLRRNGTGVP